MMRTHRRPPIACWFRSRYHEEFADAKEAPPESMQSTHIVIAERVGPRRMVSAVCGAQSLYGPVLEGVPEARCSRCSVVAAIQALRGQLWLAPREECDGAV